MCWYLHYSNFGSWKKSLLGLSRQFEQINFGTFGMFPNNLSAPILILWVPCPCFLSINHYFYKKLSFYIYPNSKHLFWTWIWIWAAKNWGFSHLVFIVRASNNKHNERNTEKVIKNKSILAMLANFWHCWPPLWNVIDEDRYCGVKVIKTPQKLRFFAKHCSSIMI